MRGLTVALLFCLAVSAPAQRHKLTINAETPEGQLLQQIGQESDEAKKLVLMEQFAEKYPKHEAILWVYSQMIPAYGKASQSDKALPVCEKLLAIDPEDAEGAHGCLKAAESKKDPDLILQWAPKASDVARKVAALPKPANEDEAEAWKQRVDFAKQLEVYTEYSLYAAALAAPQPAQKIALVEMLEKRNPQCQYLPQVMGMYFMAIRQSGDNDKAVAVAEKVLEKDQSSEDMLLVVADSYLRRKTDPNKVLAYAAKLVELKEKKPKPEGVSDQDWTAKKNLTIGLGHYMTGVIYAGQNNYPQMDKAFRAALPLVQGNQQLLAETLFHLGVANYRMGDKGGADQQQRILDAYKFSQQCAAIKSPFQAAAQKNVAAMRTQYRFR